MSNRVILFFGGLLLPISAYAYIGPGMGAGAFASAIGVVVSIFLALFSILYYPIKRMIKKRKRASSDVDQTEALKDSNE